MGSYKTIVADPPWNVKAGPLRSGYDEGWVNRGDGQTRDLQYPSMSVGDIKRFTVGMYPIKEIAAADAHLYLWTINRYVAEAYDVARAWGFEPSTLLVWAKNPMGGGLGGRFGISTEFILFCRRGSLPKRERIGTTWFNWKRPYDERGKPKHSAKPPEFIDLVERVSPGQYLELFSREQKSRFAWFYHGDESLNTAQLPAERSAANNPNSSPIQPQKGKS